MQLEPSARWTGKPDAWGVIRARVREDGLKVLGVGAASLIVASASPPLASLPIGDVDPRIERAIMILIAGLALAPVAWAIGLALLYRRLARRSYVVTPTRVSITDGGRERSFETDPAAILVSRRGGGAIGLGNRVRLVGVGERVATVLQVFGIAAATVPVVRSLRERRFVEKAAIALALAPFAVVLGAQWSERPQLGSALAGTTRVRVRPGGMCHRSRAEEANTLFEVTDRDSIACLTSWLEGSAYGRGKCMCCGGPSLEFFRGDRLVTTLTVHHDEMFEWFGVWKENAAFSGAAARFWRAWFATKGAARDAGPEPPESRPLGPCHTSIASIAFSPDGTLLASAGYDGVIKIWRTSELMTLSKKLESPFQRRDNAPVTSEVAPRPTRALVSKVTRSAPHAAVSRLGQWLAKTERRRPSAGDRPAFLQVRFLPDGRHVLATDVYGALELWDIDGQEPERVYEGMPDNWCRTIAVSADGRFALTGARVLHDMPWMRDDTCVLWDVGKETARRRLLGITDIADNVALSSDGERAAAVDYRRLMGWGVKNRALVWDTSTGRVIRSLPEGDWHELVAEPRHGLFVFGSTTPDLLTAVDMKTGETVWTKPIKGWPRLAVLADGSLARWVEEIRRPDDPPPIELEFIDAATGAATGIATIPAMDSFKPVAVSPDGRWLALTTANDRQVNLFALVRRAP